MKIFVILLTVMILWAGPAHAGPQPETTTGRNHARQVPIFMYHHITDQLNNTSRPNLSVSPRDFARQLDYLAQHGYTTLTVSQAMEMRPLPEKAVVLSFDDGYLDFYTQAWPLLKQHGMTATLFVVSADLGGYNQWDVMAHKGIPREQLISKAQMLELEKAGIEIGGHSATHPMLTGLGADQLRRELTNCQQTLAGLLGHSIKAFSYPYGMYNDQICQIVNKAGFIFACTTDEILSARADKLRLPRFFVARGESLGEFISVLEKIETSNGIARN